MHNKYNHAGFAMGCNPAFHHHNRGFGRKYGGAYRRPKHNVPINIIENEATYDVHVFALGFDKENIKISVSGDALYIVGTRTIANDYKPNFTTQEYPIKSFERVLDLSGQVDAANITATQENGILKIALPKTEGAKKTEQEIKVN